MRTKIFIEGPALNVVAQNLGLPFPYLKHSEKLAFLQASVLAASWEGLPAQRLILLINRKGTGLRNCLGRLTDFFSIFHWGDFEKVVGKWHLSL